MQTADMVVVAILTVRRNALAEFHEFETRAAEVMAEHLGRIERTVLADDGQSSTLTEIHIIRFASDAHFAAYRTDPRLTALSALRETAISNTQVYVGVDGPSYMNG